MNLSMQCEVINVSYGTFETDKGDKIDYASVEVLQLVEPNSGFFGKRSAKIKIEGNDKESSDQIAARIMSDLSKHGAPMLMNFTGGQKIKADPKTGKSDLVITVAGYQPATK